MPRDSHLPSLRGERVQKRPNLVDRDCSDSIMINELLWWLLPHEERNYNVDERNG